MAGNLFLSILFTLYCYFNFLASLFVLSARISTSLLIEVGGGVERAGVRLETIAPKMKK